MIRTGLFALMLLAGAATAAAQSSSSPSLNQEGRWTVPGTAYGVVIGKPVLDPKLPPPALLRAIIVWLSQQELAPTTSQLPRVAFATSEEMAELRYPSSNAAQLREAGVEVVSLYDTADNMILLPEGWTGSSPAELSILVHELANHLQAGTTRHYGCPEEREAPAYAAHEKWLELFGTNLAEQFGIDGLTLLVRTHCFM